MTNVTITIHEPKQNPMVVNTQREFPFSGIPIEFLDGLAMGLHMVGGPSVKYSVTIDVEPSSKDQ